MNTQNRKIKNVWWQLRLLAIAFTLVGFADSPSGWHSVIASNSAVGNPIEPTIFPRRDINSATASEIEPTLLSIPERITNIDPLSDKRLKLLHVGKTQQQETPTSSQEEDQLDFSDTGRAGQQSAGEARGQCASEQFPLTALVPVSNWGKTVKKHPTFWFYVPAYSDSVTKIEFVFQDQNRNHLWKKQLSPGTKSDYLNVSLPQDQPELQIGQWYRWYLKIYCRGDKEYPPKVVYGWVKRVALNSSTQSQLNNSQQQPYKVYGQAGIWFDAINSLFQNHSLETTNLNFRQGWQKLIQAKGVDLDLPEPKCSELAIKSSNYQLLLPISY